MGVIVIVGDGANPSVAEIVVRGTITPGATHNPRPGISVWHLFRSSLILPADAVDLAAKFRTWYATNVAAAQVAQYTVEQVEARFLDDPTSPTAVDLTGAAGAVTGDLYAPDAAVYIQITSGMRGRSYFGSKHFCAPSEAQIDNGYLNSGTGAPAWTPVQVAIKALGVTGMTDTAGNVWKLCILSKTLSNLEAIPPTLKFVQVNDSFLNSRIGTMGRRRGDRGII